MERKGLLPQRTSPKASQWNVKGLCRLEMSKVTWNQTRSTILPNQATCKSLKRLANPWDLMITHKSRLKQHAYKLIIHVKSRYLNTLIQNRRNK